MKNAPEINFPSVPAGTNLLAVGIDLESVERMRRTIERAGDAFLQKVFSAEEIELCHARGAHAAESFAARWAAKEAFSKAIGTGIGEDVGFTDIAVLSGTRGEPLVKLSNHAAAALKKIGATGTLVSLTHTKDFAAAIILLTK